MSRSRPHNFITTAAAGSRFCRRLPAAAFGTQLLIAAAVPSAAFAHDVSHSPGAANVEESAFLKENETAMEKMMNDMAAKPTGDVDRDFALMMIPHHQGAIDMAIIELRYGKNEQLRRIAQEIIVGQMQEIAAMKLAIGQPATETTPAPTQPQAAPAMSDHHHSGTPMDGAAAKH